MWGKAQTYHDWLAELTDIDHPEWQEILEDVPLDVRPAVEAAISKKAHRLVANYDRRTLSRTKCFPGKLLLFAKKKSEAGVRRALQFGTVSRCHAVARSPPFG